MSDRPVFTVRFRAASGVDAIRALRALLKLALRRWGLRCLTIEGEDGPIALDPPHRKQSPPEETVGRWQDRDACPRPPSAAHGAGKGSAGRSRSIRASRRSTWSGHHHVSPCRETLGRRRHVSRAEQACRSTWKLTPEPTLENHARWCDRSCVHWTVIRTVRWPVIWTVAKSTYVPRRAEISAALSQRDSQRRIVSRTVFADPSVTASKSRA